MSDEVSGGSSEPARDPAAGPAGPAPDQGAAPGQATTPGQATAEASSGATGESGQGESGQGESEPPKPRRGGLDRAILDAIAQGSPTVTTTLAFIAALVIGALVIAFSNPTVLHYWNSFAAAPGTALSSTWDSIAAAYSAMFEGAIFNPHTISAAFHGGSVGAIFYPLSETAAQATPLILAGLSVALAFRAGLFNIGAASQWIGGAIVVTWLGFGVSLPPVIHVVVCLAGGFAGGAVMGWLVGALKARTGAHEVIVTIMLNYVMYDVLSYVLGTPKAIQLPHQADLISPGIASDADLPHVGGPPPQVGVGFLIAVAAAVAMWWLLARSTTGFQFRTVGANPNAARTAGMSVEKTWVLAMLLAGGLAGLSGAVSTQGMFYSLNSQSYGNYGINGITVALLGRAKPTGTVLAALLFGALEAGGTVMEAATTVPIDIVEVLQGLIVLFVAAPLMIRAVFRLRAAQGTGMETVTKGWNG
ncbi:MAG: ABC transporter permease [Streptosporangiaceae bacterium]